MIFSAGIGNRRRQLGCHPQCRQICSWCAIKSSTGTIMSGDGDRDTKAKAASTAIHAFSVGGCCAGAPPPRRTSATAFRERQPVRLLPLRRRCQAVRVRRYRFRSTSPRRLAGRASWSSPWRRAAKLSVAEIVRHPVGTTTRPCRPRPRHAGVSETLGGRFLDPPLPPAWWRWDSSASSRSRSSSG